jgi:hypothetical protein
LDIEKLAEVTHILVKTIAAEMYGLKENDSSILHSSFLVSMAEAHFFIFCRFLLAPSVDFSKKGS